MKEPKAPSARGRGRGRGGRGCVRKSHPVEAEAEGEPEPNLICGYTEDEWAAWYADLEASENCRDSKPQEQEPETEKKAPKAKTTKAKACKSSKATADKPAEHDAADGDRPKRVIFAGRRRPEKHEFNMARFDAIRSVFNKYVREEVSRPSMYEVRVFDRPKHLHVSLAI